MTEPYRATVHRGPAADFHTRPVPTPARRELWVHQVSRPALVLGSTQPDDIVDRWRCRREGIDVVRRRSGGGAVLLVPDEAVWIDVIVPRGAPGWADDVHAPMRWVGERLAASVAAISPQLGSSIVVHVGPMQRTDWSSLVCFDGLGAGEVLVGGRKLIGISQRRTRAAARLQCAAYVRYRHEELVRLLRADARPPVEDLAPVALLPAIDDPAHALEIVRTALSA